MFMASPKGGAPKYNLDGESGITVVRGGGGSIVVGIIVNDATYGGTGTIAKIQEGSSGQIDSATDWVIPNAQAGYKQVHCRATITGSGAALDTSSASPGVWYRIDTGSEVRYTITQTGLGSKVFQIDLELSFDGGSSVDVGPAQYDGFAQLV